MIDALRLAADEGDGSRQNRCRWTVMASSWNAVQASCGARVRPLELFGDPSRFDYVVFCGGLRSSKPLADRQTMSFMRRAAEARVCLIGLCTAVFELVRAGLMKGRQCAVSWFHHREMIGECPDVIPVADRLFVIDGDRITCAGGVGAGDLAAWLLRKHCGLAVSQKSLHLLQMDKVRPPESPQPQPPGWPPTSNVHVRKALRLMEENISQPASISEIATKLRLSVRQLERCFKYHIGTSPQRAFILMRLRHGRWLLNNSSFNVTSIAEEAGFSGLSHFSREFRREFGMRPSQCRKLSSRIRDERRACRPDARGSRFADTMV